MPSSNINEVSPDPSAPKQKIYATWKPGQEERNEMIRVAAYFIAERDGYKGVEAEYWNAAEYHINQILALRESYEKLQIIIDTALDAAVLMDSKGIITSWSIPAESLFGWSREEAVGRNLHETIAPLRYRKAYQQGLEQFLATGEGNILNQRIEVIALHQDGHEFPVELSVAPIKLADKYEFSAFIRDITERKQMEGALKESELRYRTVADFTSDWEYWIMPDDTLRYMSPSCEQISGYTADEFYADPQLMTRIIHPEDLPLYLGHTHPLSAQGVAEPIDYRIHTKSGECRWISHVCRPVYDPVGQPLGRRASNRDITERKQMEDQVRQLAFYDTLTRLPNRRLLNDRLNQAMAASKRNACYGAVMFLDLDNFKPLNDTHGHEVGDLLLIEVADRLRSCMREMDTVARFGGDEFVVILGELNTGKAESIAQAQIVAEKIRIALAQPYLLAIKRDGQGEATIEHRCTASIGVVLFYNHESAPEDILKWADTVMYQAKEAGRNQIRFYAAKT